MICHKLLVKKPLDCKLLGAGCNISLLVLLAVIYSALHDEQLRPQEYLCIMLGAVHTYTNWVKQYEMD